MPSATCASWCPRGRRTGTPRATATPTSRRCWSATGGCPGGRRRSQARPLAGDLSLRVRRAARTRALDLAVEGRMRSILRRLLAGELSEAEAEAELRRVQLDELGGRARLDLGRTHRRGLPEVVLAGGKEPAEAARLVVALAMEQGQGLISRLEPDCRRDVERQGAEAGCSVLFYHSAARVLRPGFTPEPRPGRVAVLTAGTADLAAADEARMVVEAAGLEARIEADV